MNDGNEQLLRGRFYGHDHNHDDPNPGPFPHQTYAALVGGPLDGLLLDIDGWSPEEIENGVAVLALTACAVLAGARSLLAVSEWVADAPEELLERFGIRVDPLFPKRSWPAETTIRRVLARIDANALDRAVGIWLAGRQQNAGGLQALAVDGKSLRVPPAPRAGKSTSWSPATTSAGWSSHRWTSVRRPTRSLDSGLCWTRCLTCPAPS